MLLFVSSYLFYASWNWKCLGLIVLSTMIDYAAAIRMECRPSHRRRTFYLLISVFSNLFILGFFKYSNFFIESASELLSVCGFHVSGKTLNLILPVGISFYTFQTMSYTIDVYLKRQQAERNFISFATYVAFFPQLIAGPIERAGNLLNQINTERKISGDNICLGLLYFAHGYFMKTLIADNLNPLTSGTFDAGQPERAGIYILLASMAYAVQIYCDFCGYSLMAKGLAKILGFNLMENFEFPYIAKNPADLWRRWHVSLSNWFRDYVYIPLGGNRHGRTRTLMNVIIVMGLCGLWHGADWTYVLWGLYHGLMYVLYEIGFNRLSKPSALGRSAVNFVQAAFVFMWWSFGFILFRSNSIQSAYQFYLSVFSDFIPSVFDHKFFIRFIFFTTVFTLFELFRYRVDLHKKGTAWISEHPVRAAVATSFFAAVWLIFNQTQEKVFIYFQF